MEDLGIAHLADRYPCLIATHNVSIAPRLDRVLEMADGRLAHAAAP